MPDAGRQANSPAAALSSGSGVSPRGWHHLAAGNSPLHLGCKPSCLHTPWHCSFRLFLRLYRTCLKTHSCPRDPKIQFWESPGLCALIEFGQSLPIKIYNINISCVWQYDQGHNDPHSIQSLPAQPCHEQSDPHRRQPADIPNPDRIWKKKRGDRSWTNMSKLVQLTAYWHLQLDTERNALSPLQHTATTDPFWWCSLHTPSGRNVCTMPEQRSVQTACKRHQTPNHSRSKCMYSHW